MFGQWKYLLKQIYKVILWYTAGLTAYIKIICVSKGYVPIQTLVIKIAMDITGWIFKFFILWDADCMILRVFCGSESSEIAFKT